MFVAWAAAFAGLDVPPPRDDGVIELRHDLSPKYSRSDYESACGSNIFRVRFRNGPDERGRVDHMTIDGRSVIGAAELLQIRAARRGIDKIEIMNCGMDERRPVFRGVMAFSEIESRSLGMRWLLFFRLSREGRGAWRLVVD